MQSRCRVKGFCVYIWSCVCLPVCVHTSQESEESGRTSASRGFDVDYGRFYNSSYLKTTPASSSGSSSNQAATGSRAGYRRSPSVLSSSSPSHAGFRHYHRPQQENFSYSRHLLRTGNKGVTFTHHVTCGGVA